MSDTKGLPSSVSATPIRLLDSTSPASLQEARVEGLQLAQPLADGGRVAARVLGHAGGEELQLG
jgi:hypothetical protein